MCNLRVESADAYPSMSSIGIRRRLKVRRAFLCKFSPTVSSPTRGSGRPYSELCSIREDEDEMTVKNQVDLRKEVVQVLKYRAFRLRASGCHVRDPSNFTFCTHQNAAEFIHFISSHQARGHYVTIYRSAVTSESLRATCLRINIFLVRTVSLIGAHFVETTFRQRFTMSPSASVFLLCVD